MTWLTARELAGLPGMASTKAGNRMRLERLGVPSRPRPGREGGGGLEYDTSRLPPETQRAIAARAVSKAVAQAAPAAVEAQPAPVHALPTPAKSQAAPAGRRMPSDADRACADARATLVNVLNQLVFLHGTKKGAALLALELASGRAGEGLVATAAVANRRQRDGQALSARTLERWLATHREQGWWGLLPAAAEPARGPEVEQDVAAVLGLYHSRDPQFRNLSQAAKDVTRKLGRDFDTWPALYKRALRLMPKVNPVDLIKARHTGAERAAKLPFKRRDTSVLKPLDVWLIDGHTFKAKVRHPDHGAPFAPEVTLVIDAATRLVCGWSVSLSENTIAVGDALRHAVGNHGVPAVVYSDNGSGERAKAIDCPVVGLMERLGSEHRFGIPGHPQGHGLIERSWQTHMINCARQFGSYQGRDVDAGTFRKAAAELAKEQRALKRAEATGEVVRLSTKAPTWAQFVEAVGKAVDEYNATHRHRGLPRHAEGPHAGKHQTPAEAWAQRLDPSRQIRLSPLDLKLLFMPAMVRTAQRGEVTFLNQHYQAPELMAHGVNGRQVSVRYDIHDPSYVLIFTLDGEFVCEAKFNRSRIDYMPKAVVDIGHEKRVKAMVKRREQQIEVALRELDGKPLALPEPGNPLVFDAPLAEAIPIQANREVGEREVEIARPFFNASSDRYEWLMTHRGAWTADDQAWAERYVKGEDYEALADYYAGRGMAWAEGPPAQGFEGAR
jgi:putative transposase